MCGGDDDYPEKDKKAANDPKNKTPEELKNGIKMERKCTDGWMCCIFFLFFCGMFATAGYGYANGDPYNLITPFDSNGNKCGIGGEPTETFKYVYWPSLISLNYDTRYCVVGCPRSGEMPNCYNDTITNDCGFSGYNTKLYLERFCFPDGDDIKNYTTQLFERYFGNGLAKYMGDLAICWWLFIVMALISFVISLIYLFLLRCMAKPLLYISFILILALFVGGGFYVFFQQDRYQEGDNTRTVMKWCGIGLWILAGLYLIILLCCCSRIRLGIAIIQATSQFVANKFSIFLVPIFFFLIIMVWIAYWIVSAVYVYSVGEVYDLGQIKWSNTTRYVWIYHLFGLFWISAFINGCCQFIIASVACIWYFAQGGSSDDKAKASISMGIKWIFRYHMGSVAFGALIIAIMQMIKLLFEYIRKKYEKAVPQNPVTKCIICCLRCCIWYLDYCVKFITKNAYIQIALTSNNFCWAAWQAFCLIVRNCARFAIISGIGTILMFLGKGIIMGLSGWIGYLILMNSDFKDQIASPVFPVIIFVILAYLISSVFLSVYSFASTAILHAFLLDEEVGGNRAPSALMEFVNRHDRTKQGGGSNQNPSIQGKGEGKANNIA